MSVVIPAFNAEATLGAALRSVVHQTYRDFEVVVCDDGSHDRSSLIAREILSAGNILDWRILPLGGLGAGGARNRGIEASRGEFVAFLDDDDSWAPEKLALCMHELESGPLDLVCHSEIWQDEDGRRWERRYSDLFDEGQPPIISLMRNNPFSTSAVVVRRDCLDRAGRFDESIPSAEDYDLWIRLVLLPGFRIGFIDRPLGVYVLREGSESSKVDRRLQALLIIGDRYKEPLRSASPWGGLEHQKYLGKTYFTAGVRYAQRGRRFRGALMAMKGLAMWPFRLEWVTMALKDRARRSVGDPT